MAAASAKKGAKRAVTAEKQGWTEVKEAINFFVNDFMKACVIKGGPFKEGEWHVVFAFGTVVRFNLAASAPNEIWEYNPNSDDDYPTHRFQKKKDLTRQLKDNVKEWTAVLQSQSKYTNVIRTAYKIMFSSGYPLPGGMGADSTTMPFGKRGDGLAAERQREPEIDNKEKYQCLWGITFPFLETGENQYIYSLAMTESENMEREATAYGREARRYDYMIPRIVAIVSHDRTITHFE